MKIFIIFCSLVFIVLLSGCLNQNNAPKNDNVNATINVGSDGSNVNQPKTVEELKQQKITNPSEFDKCKKEIEDQDKKLQQCILDKLKEKGYSDGLNCIQNFNNPICKSLNANGEATYERYNAEVDAYNECLKNQPQGLTLLDCMKLIDK